MLVFPITRDYIILLIKTYIEDYIDKDWINVIDDVYENLKQKAHEIELLTEQQPLDIDPDSANYENFKLLIDGYYQPDNMTPYKFYNLMAMAGLIGKSMFASGIDLSVLHATIERYVIDKNLEVWFRHNVGGFVTHTINID